MFLSIGIRVCYCFSLLFCSSCVLFKLWSEIGILLCNPWSLNVVYIMYTGYMRRKNGTKMAKKVKVQFFRPELMHAGAHRIEIFINIVSRMVPRQVGWRQPGSASCLGHGYGSKLEYVGWVLPNFQTGMANFKPISLFPPYFSHPFPNFNLSSPHFHSHHLTSTTSFPPLLLFLLPTSSTPFSNQRLIHIGFQRAAMPPLNSSQQRQPRSNRRAASVLLKILSIVQSFTTTSSITVERSTSEQGQHRD